MPYLAFMAQSVAHPSVEVQPVELGYKRMQQIPFTGDQLANNTLTIDVLLDEDMKVYGEIYNWFIKSLESEHIVNKASYFAKGDTELTNYHDMRVQILTSANNTNREFVYVNSLPVSLGDINFAATNEEIFITCPISFRFDYFNFI